ncbi:MAG: hypothetical protein PVI79_11425 [Gammaproteobacteria bacterium]|jgi:hypothetical protein
MSEQLFEVAFSGQVSDGANPEEVKAKVGKMFNADEGKLAQLFSGRRVVIKKNIDKATAAKYKTALNRAGAECEVNPMGGAAAAAPAAPAKKPAAPPAGKPAAAAAAPADYGDVAPPPQTDPLGITGDQIEDMSATLAPVGSELQDSYEVPEEPRFDLSEFDVAPVGADIGSGKKEPDPPPPDTSGLALED